jgi:hypothetical protein
MAARQSAGQRPLYQRKDSAAAAAADLTALNAKFKHVLNARAPDDLYNIDSNHASDDASSCYTDGSASSTPQSNATADGSSDGEAAFQFTHLAGMRRGYATQTSREMFMGVFAPDSQESIKIATKNARAAGSPDVFLPVEFLTPLEQARYDAWVNSNRIGPDPRMHLPQLCNLCYVAEVTIRHMRAMNNCVPDGDALLDPMSRNFLPLNRYEVIVGVDEYAAHCMLPNALGAEHTGHVRLGNGGSLIVGHFPQFRTANYSVVSRPDTALDGTTRRVMRPVVLEHNLQDFRRSSAR